ncbi:MAG: hypothetical protein NZ898_02955 [Myxococcota bacterium]|nr:hypothetical protein [Myxococcota bacterium]MDW8360983.1 hypothetical protein [Myxococcales bacterium]
MVDGPAHAPDHRPGSERAGDRPGSSPRPCVAVDHDDRFAPCRGAGDGDCDRRVQHARRGARPRAGLENRRVEPACAMQHHCSGMHPGGDAGGGAGHCGVGDGQHDDVRRAEPGRGRTTPRRRRDGHRCLARRVGEGAAHLAASDDEQTDHGLRYSACASM